MIRALREFLQSLAPLSGETGPSNISVQLATAVLLVEAMRADDSDGAPERAAVLHILQSRFALATADVEELLAMAEDRSRAANDFFAFTSVLNDRMSQPEKVQVVEEMWRVAYVDGSIEAGESHVISKVAGLLYVPHGDYIAAKLRAKEAAGLM